MTRRTIPSGRPLEFAPDDALEAAIRVFWERGFEGTSLQDLETRTGLARSSLYNSFGSKRAIFDRAIAEYQRRAESVFKRLESANHGLQDIHDFIDRLVEQRAGRGVCRGCLMVNSMIEFGGKDPAVARSGKQHFARVREAFVASLKRAASLGEISSDGIDARARLLFAIAMGVNVEARAGATRDDLAALAAAAHRQIDDWRLGATSKRATRRA